MLRPNFSLDDIRESLKTLRDVEKVIELGSYITSSRHPLKRRTLKTLIAVIGRATSQLVLCLEFGLLLFIFLQRRLQAL